MWFAVYSPDNKTLLAGGALWDVLAVNCGQSRRFRRHGEAPPELAKRLGYLCFVVVLRF